MVKSVKKELKKFVNMLVGNRVFDVYLKYMGIKTLTTATLVPVALLAGKDAFEEFMKEEKIEQTGGKNLPILDDPLVGNYLKLAGLSVLELTADTLVPLGIIAVLYNTYLKK